VPTIVDYASLTQAISDFLHRSDLQTSGFTDYLIQGAQEKINDDIFELNFGNGIRLMENGYPATAISNGVAPVPSDWLAPKNIQVVDNAGNIFSLVFKSASWIYDRYPVRQPQGLPAYIARDTSSSASFPANNNPVSLTPATQGQTVYAIPAQSFGLPILFISVDGVLMTPTTDYTISGTTLTFTNGLTAGQIPAIWYPQIYVPGSSANSSFIFGPYPDSAYTIQGTYYQKAPLLSNSQTTNWMVLNSPMLLHAACMIKAGEFLVDDAMIARWTALYQPRLEALVNRDKAERWAASTMQVEVG